MFIFKPTVAIWTQNIKSLFLHMKNARDLLSALFWNLRKTQAFDKWPGGSISESV
jgi:hypothetical protein